MPAPRSASAVMRPSRAEIKTVTITVNPGQRSAQRRPRSGQPLDRRGGNTPTTITESAAPDVETADGALTFKITDLPDNGTLKLGGHYPGPENAFLTGSPGTETWPTRRPPTSTAKAMAHSSSRSRDRG